MYVRQGAFQHVPARKGPLCKGSFIRAGHAISSQHFAGPGAHPIELINQCDAVTKELCVREFREQALNVAVYASPVIPKTGCSKSATVGDPKSPGAMGKELSWEL